jgi:hypothetical protein
VWPPSIECTNTATLKEQGGFIRYNPQAAKAPSAPAGAAGFTRTFEIVPAAKAGVVG